MQTTLLGVSINTETLPQVKEKIKQFLNSNKQHIVVTPNPEFLVNAQKDREFKKILNSADLAIADGVGMKMAAKLYGEKVHRITGVDFIWDLCDIAAKQNKSVFLLGGAPGVAQAASEKITKKYPTISIVGATDGGKFSDEGEAVNQHIISQINQAQPDVLIVALGQVKQEKCIARYLAQLPTVRIAIGVGGAFDFISGKIRRAPKILRKNGFEWLYRLLQQPKRARRIADAIIVFPYLVIKDKMRKKLD